MKHSMIARDLRRVSRYDPFVLLPEKAEESLGRYWLDRMDFDSEDLAYVRDEESLQDAGRIRDQLTWLLEQKERFGEYEFGRRVLRDYSVFDDHQTATRILYVAGSEIVNWWPQVYKGITFDEIMAVKEFCEATDPSVEENLGAIGDPWEKFIPKLGLLNKLRQKNENLPPLTKKELQFLNELVLGESPDCPYDLKCPANRISCGMCRNQVHKKVEHYHYYQNIGD